MKFNILSVLLALLVLISFSCQPPAEETQEEESPVSNGIQWGTEDEIATHMAFQGIGRMMNIEFQMAYVLFEEAVEKDPTMFACHTALAFMSDGEKRDYHTSMAKQHVEGKNETSQLFVSLLDVPRDSTGADQAAEIWAKMHELSNGPFIHFRYALSRTDTAEVLSELDKLEAFLVENDYSTGHVNNIRAYIYHGMGDAAKSTEAVEKYMADYDGYNPLDTRAELYLLDGDTARAIEYYEKAAEKFPFSWSANNALDKLDPEE